MIPTLGALSETGLFSIDAETVLWGCTSLLALKIGQLFGSSIVREMRRGEEVVIRGYTGQAIVHRSVLSSLLLRYVDTRSYGASRVAVGPETVRTWRAEIGGAAAPDPHLSRVGRSRQLEESKRNNVKVTVEPDIALNSDLKKRVDELVERNVTAIRHVEQAHHHWNMLHAIDVLERFVNHEDSPSRVRSQLDLQGLLRASATECINRQDSFSSISVPFSRCSEFFGIHDPAWAFIARPLFALDVLERVVSSQRAQEIALEEVSRYLDASTSSPE
jgi:hypothetical protein